MLPDSRSTARMQFHPPTTSDRSLSLVVSRLQQSTLFRDYQEAFEATTGLPLVLRAAGSFRTPLQGSKRANGFCALMTQENKSCASCLQVQQQLEDEATHGPKTIKCYAGLSESAVPVRVGERILAYLQTGQVFLSPPTKQAIENITSFTASGKDDATLRTMKSAYLLTRTIPRKQYESILRLLTIFAEHLGTISNRLLVTEVAPEPAAMTRIRAFISSRQGDAICLLDVARAANMSACYFCRVFKRTTGLTFTDYLARERIESAKVMLHNSHTRISEAAYAAGFQSLSQFNRVFRRIEGESPSHYRDHLGGSKRSPHRITSLIHAA